MIFHQAIGCHGLSQLALGGKLRREFSEFFKLGGTAMNLVSIAKSAKAQRRMTLFNLCAVWGLRSFCVWGSETRSVRDLSAAIDSCESRPLR
jgi:hypothetical protein